MASSFSGLTYVCIIFCQYWQPCFMILLSSFSQLYRIAFITTLNCWVSYFTWYINLMDTNDKAVSKWMKFFSNKLVTATSQLVNVSIHQIAQTMNSRRWCFHYTLMHHHTFIMTMIRCIDEFLFTYVANRTITNLFRIQFFTFEKFLNFGVIIGSNRQHFFISYHIT